MLPDANVIPAVRVTLRLARPFSDRVPASARAAAGRALFAVLFAAIAASVLLSSPPRSVTSPFRAWVSALYPAPPLPKPWPQSLELLAAREVRERVPAGSTLTQELRRAGLPEDTTRALVHAASEVIDLRRIRAGQPYRLYLDGQNRLLAFRYELNRQDSWVFTFEEEAWVATRVTIPVRTNPVFLSASISTSLDAALAAAVPSVRVRNELVQRIADLYGWDVDFAYDLRAGDRLEMLVQERYVEDEFVGYGDVLAAEFRVGGRRITVVRYEDSEGHVAYFAPDGTSLRRTFLRSPVPYQRISSRFSYRRVHPVTGIPRAHRGVDYVAPPGTPVQATADGVVLEAGYRREPGRYVKIRHGGSYASVYMHLSRIAEGIKVGAEVKQGQIIGYVGKTGNATGYHLHYGLQQAGRYVDPLKLQVPAAAPVPASDWTRFLEQRDRWLRLLQERRQQRAVAVAGGA